MGIYIGDPDSLRAAEICFSTVYGLKEGYLGTDSL